MTLHRLCHTELYSLFPASREDRFLWAHPHRRKEDGSYRFELWKQCASKLLSSPPPHLESPGVSEPHGPAILGFGFKSFGQAIGWGSGTACVLDPVGSAPGGRPPSAKGLGKAEFPSPGGGFLRPAVPLHGDSYKFLVHPLVKSSCVLMRAGRREICHHFCCISQGLPSIILETPQKQPF